MSVAPEMNVVFVNYHDFTSNSAIHIFHLANALVALGAECAVCVPSEPGSVSAIGEPRFQVLDYEGARNGLITFRNAGAPTFVHAWTPRECVRRLTNELTNRHGWPYVVHLEDHEAAVTAETLGLTLSELAALPSAELDRRIADHLSHPVRARDFLAEAAGVTVILDRLLEMAPEHLPAEVIWPAYEKDLFAPQPGDVQLRTALGLRDNERVVVYTGNAHAANAAELRSLYLAIDLVNRRGYPTKLIRLGRNFVDFLGPELQGLNVNVIDVGYRPRHELPKLLALADALVQPGRSSPFNDYRFPAKLPEFLAMGRPVILPATNLGRYLEDGDECLLLQKGHAIEIADAIENVFGDAALAARLGERGRSFAERAFSWRGSASRLHALYGRIAGGTTIAGNDVDLEAITRRYGDYSPPAVGYATVRDYCDSADHLPFLASANNDMKDVQRPWMLKAILGCVPQGGRLLEIGAGTPIVADLLSRLGYDVWVIDPYDGRDGGPDEFSELRARYPRVQFVRNTFPMGLDPGNEGSFDCIYSISVLEHIPSDAVADVCDGIRRFARDEQSWTIHAVDHVFIGDGAAQHHANLSRFADAFGISSGELSSALARVDSDPEVYFLSAEGHNRWRGATPYEEFPMRRCISVQLCVPAQVVADATV